MGEEEAASSGSLLVSFKTLQVLNIFQWFISISIIMKAIASTDKKKMKIIKPNLRLNFLLCCSIPYLILENDSLYQS